MRLMPIPCPPLRAWTLLLAAVVLGLTLFATRAAQTPAAPSGHVRPAAAAAPAEPEPAKSVFRIPATPQEGRDPFFPQSTRTRRPVVVPTASNAAPVVIAELELKGISGPMGHRFAIINNRTFETGEEGEVSTNVGRVRLTCKEIKDDAVRVLLAGQERILTLRPPVR